jgi:hypothetical protein
MEMLAEEFVKDPDWTKERLYELSVLTGLSEGQIYKWGWDQRRKLQLGEMPMPLGLGGSLAQSNSILFNDESNYDDFDDVERTTN